MHERRLSTRRIQQDLQTLRVHTDFWGPGWHGTTPTTRGAHVSRSAGNGRTCGRRPARQGHEAFPSWTISRLGTRGSDAIERWRLRQPPAAVGDQMANQRRELAPRLGFRCPALQILGRDPHLVSPEAYTTEYSQGVGRVQSKGGPRGLAGGTRGRGLTRVVGCIS